MLAIAFFVFFFFWPVGLLLTLITVVHGTVLLFENLIHAWERW
jgi:hypothetical protein